MRPSRQSSRQLAVAEGARKRRKLNDDDYGSEEQQAQNDPDEIPDLPQRKQEISLSGQAILIYSRDEDDPECISDMQLVLKGEWNMGIEGTIEEFIYKRTAPAQNDELLTALFCEDPDDRVPIPDLSKVFNFNPSDPKQF